MEEIEEPTKGNNLKNEECIVCKRPIPEDRPISSLTCKKDCSKNYIRIAHYVRENMKSKNQTEIKRLKKLLKEVKK